VKLKALAIGVGTLAMLAVAGLLVQRMSGGGGAADRVGKPVLATIDLAQAGSIEFTGPKGQVTLTATPQGWLVEQQARFPADQGKLSSFLFKLNSEKLADKVTENPARLAELGLLTAEENQGKQEEHKTGTLFQVKDGAGKPMFQLLVGKDRQPTATTSAFGGQYVRFPGESAAYLIGTTLFAETDAKEWISKPVLTGEANKQFKTIRVQRSADRKPLVFSREKADSPWQLDGATVRGLNTKEIENLAKRIADLEVVQIAKPDADAATLGRAKVAKLEAVAFDGRAYRFELGEAKAPDSFRYLSVSAEAGSGVDDAGKKAVGDFNDRYHGRLLAVYDWDAARLLKERKEYLDKPEAK
jgi:hypothetical protein